MKALLDAVQKIPDGRRLFGIFMAEKYRMTPGQYGNLDKPEQLNIAFQFLKKYKK